MNIDALLGIIGQLPLPDGQGTVLAKKNDESCFNQLHEEASIPGNRPDELQITLTELMTVLKPIINENSSTKLASLSQSSDEI
jgi:hypothetical protein